MSDTCTISWCDLPNYSLTFKLEQNVIDTCPALNIALCALSRILMNDHLLMNFSTHFIPYDEYTGKFPSVVSQSIMKKMKDTFTTDNTPSIILQDNDFSDATVSCAVYGCYKGRKKETETEIIYLNKQLIDCSKYNDHPENIIKYASIILLKILHEFGHWCFHHYSCNMDHNLSTPKGVLMEEAGQAVEFLLFGFQIQHYGPVEPKFMIDDIVTKFNDGFRIIPIDYLKKLFQSSTYANIKDHTSLMISIKELKHSVILHEELLTFSYKRVFNPTDEAVLNETTTNTIGHQIGRRIFNPCDK